MNNKHQDLLFPEDPNDFQLTGDLIPSKSWEEEEKERIEKAYKKAEEETPNMFEDEILFSWEELGGQYDFTFSKGGKTYRYGTYTKDKAERIITIGRKAPGKAWSIAKKCCGQIKGR